MDRQPADAAPESPKPALPIAVDAAEVVGAEEATGLRPLLDELKARVAEISAHELDLQRRENELDDARRKLEELASTESIVQLRRVRRKLSEQRERLKQREAELQKLRASTAATATQPADLADMRRRLEEQETTIRQRRDDVDKLYAQASEVAQTAQRRNAESLRMRQQLEARDVELRRLEMELAQQRDERPPVVADPVAAPPLHSQSVPASAPRAATVASPRFRRSLPRLIAAAAAVFLITLWLNPVAFRTTAVIRVHSTREQPTIAVAEHTSLLGDGDLTAKAVPGEPSAAWRAALGEGRAAARAIAEPPAIELTLSAPSEAVARDSMTALFEAYDRHVVAQPVAELRSRRFDEWRQRREQLAGELRERQAELAALDEQLHQDQNFATWDRVKQELSETRARFDQLATDAAAEQSRFELLKADSSPVGVVTAEQLEQALVADPVFREDQKELASQFRTYRVELAVAMVVANEPLASIRESLLQLSNAVTEQRDLQPPPAVRERLEVSLAETTEIIAQCAATTQEWERRRQRVERVESADAAGELTSLQADAVREANRLIGALGDFARVVGKRLDELTADSASGTREMVVASVVRGRLSAVTERTQLLAQALAQTEVSTNFRLDAADRQVRAIRARLASQRDQVRQSLQIEADQAAREQHDRQLAESAARLAQLQSDREHTSRLLGERIEAMNNLEDRTRELRRLATDRDTAEAAACAAEQRLAAHDAQRPLMQPDRLTLERVTTTQVSGSGRWGGAMLLAALTVAAIVGASFSQRRGGGGFA